MFAIHRRGYYGGIVGRGYETMAEYRALVAEAKRQGADSIKLMFSGILTFTAWGGLSCPGLPEAEIRAIYRTLMNRLNTGVLCECLTERERTALLPLYEIGVVRYENGRLYAVSVQEKRQIQNAPLYRTICLE